MEQHAKKQPERRNDKRLSIHEEVFDQKTGKSLGHTADLNAYGMMLVGVEKFDIGTQTRVSIDIPNGKNNKIRTSLTAECRWSEQHLSTPFFNSGFRFIYATEFDVEYIETLFFGLMKQ